jgi:UDPglucose 6-dehydrogenase
LAEAAKILPEYTYVEDAYAACAGADAVILLTEWNQYRALDLERLRGVMKMPLFIDLQNVYGPEKMRESGFAYVGVGRKVSP